MRGERWRQVDKIFRDLIEQTPEQRALFLDRLCADDPSLKKELEELIQAYERSGSFLDSPAPVSVSGSLVGRTLGSFEVKALIGSGGMGEVYRAWDSKLKRDVAIKVLPPHLIRDAERIARFQREAEVLASLNHPHIGVIYDLMQVSDSRFLVLELVEGDTLADQITGGRIPIDAALPIAKQIAEALEAAHERGIIHRDLKPANIKITSDGVVKVLDFGLAKVCASKSTTLPEAPTKVTASAQGMFFGTAAYMSPEQVKGLEADRTSDVWAFGCVLYEMLTGHAVFKGKTVGEIFEAVFKLEPDWHELPQETPESIRRLLRRCLQKDRKLRFHDMSDVRIEIEDAPSRASSDFVTSLTGRRSERLAWVTLLTVVTLIAVEYMVRTTRPLPDSPEMRVEITTPPASDPSSVAISPDGGNIVFEARIDGHSQLWLRALNSNSSRPLPGTDGADLPFWSPNGRSIGFFAAGKLKRIDIDVGSVQTLASDQAGRGGAWNSKGMILFAVGGSGLFRVSDTGDGEPVPVTHLMNGQSSHRFPQFLPDGDHFIYYATGDPGLRGVYLGKLNGSEGRRLLDADAAAVVTSSGQLFFPLRGKLYGQDLDPQRLVPVGNPFLVDENGPKVLGTASNLGGLSSSAQGRIAYRTGSADVTQFSWFDRSGREIEKVGDPDSNSAVGPSFSPDGGYVALRRTIDGNVDVWLLELRRRLLSRFTFDPREDSFSAWSPDSKRLVFNSNRTGAGDYFLYEKRSDGAPGSEELLLAVNAIPTSWSRDGRFLLYEHFDSKTQSDIWALPLDQNGKPNGKEFPVVRTDADEAGGKFSPDGKWVAYTSNESGRAEVYVQSFPVPIQKSRISSDGGYYPVWRPDGNELFYVSAGHLMAVSIRPSAHGLLEPGAPSALFPTRLGPGFEYGVSADGKRFLMNTIIQDASMSPIALILNWKRSP
jgi:serine/threonine protein kinase